MTQNTSKRISEPCLVLSRCEKVFYVLALYFYVHCHKTVSLKEGHVQQVHFVYRNSVLISLNTIKISFEVV